MRFANDRAGATAIEYGLLAAFIAIVIIGAVSATGTQTAALYQSAANGFSSA